MDVTEYLKADGLKWYPEIIGSLGWAVVIGRIDILLEVSLLSTHLSIPQEGHLEQFFHIFGCIGIQKNIRLFFYCSYPIISYKLFKEHDWFDFYRDEKEAITPNIPESRGNKVYISMFVDAELAGINSTRRSQTGVLIFIN